MRAGLSTFGVALACAVFAGSADAAEICPETEGYRFPDVYRYVEGAYDVIGRAPDGRLYEGLVRMTVEGCGVAVVRCVGDARVEGRGVLESILDGHDVKVLRVRFADDALEPIAYAIYNDPNNYAVLEGWNLEKRHEFLSFSEPLSYAGRLDYPDPPVGPDCR